MGHRPRPRLAKHLLSVLSAVWLLALAGCAPPPAAVPNATGPPMRGVNLGNALEAPNEGEWGLVIQDAFLRRIAEAGFGLVRIPIRWSAHAQAQPPYAIDSAFFARVDEVVTLALDAGLVTVINMHHYDALTSDPAAHVDRFLAMWRQIALRYADRDGRLWFEPLNEPNARLGGALWNAYAAHVISAIRETNPTRTIVVGPGDWNSIDRLDALALPDGDPSLMVTFHYYSPYHFTHQGAEWAQGSGAWLGTRWEGSAFERQAIQSDLDRAQAWAQRRGYRLFLGEFGAYNRADTPSRVRWTAFVAREAEKRGMAWAYWEFGAGFGVYDPAADAWREDLLAALMPR